MVGDGWKELVSRVSVVCSSLDLGWEGELEQWARGRQWQSWRWPSYGQGLLIGVTGGRQHGCKREKLQSKKVFRGNAPKNNKMIAPEIQRDIANCFAEVRKGCHIIFVLQTMSSLIVYNDFFLFFCRSS